MSPFLTDEVSPELSPSPSPSQGKTYSPRLKSCLHKTVVAMATILPLQRSMSLMSIVLRKLYTNYELSRT